MRALSTVCLSDIFRSSGDGGTEDWVGTCILSQSTLHRWYEGKERGHTELPLDF